MFVSRFTSFATVGCALTILIANPAAAESFTDRVKFAAGASSATIKGSVTGYDTHNYLLGASAGQVMSVLFSANNNACYFNLVEPGADAAFHRGEIDGNEYAGNLKASGDYRIEVYLMRSEARRGKTCRYNVTAEISGKSASASGDEGSSDALVPGTDFNATGVIPCARFAGQPMAQCKFGVKREDNGNGVITVFWPDAGNRVIFFEASRPTSFDMSQADGNAKMNVSQNSDLFIVTIGDMRFEIPAAVMEGG
jgi:hypothetical protein